MYCISSLRQVRTNAEAAKIKMPRQQSGFSVSTITIKKIDTTVLEDTGSRTYAE